MAKSNNEDIEDIYYKNIAINKIAISKEITDLDDFYTFWLLYANPVGYTLFYKDNDNGKIIIEKIKATDLREPAYYSEAITKIPFEDSALYSVLINTITKIIEPTDFETENTKKVIDEVVNELYDGILGSTEAQGYSNGDYTFLKHCLDEALKNDVIKDEIYNINKNLETLTAKQTLEEIVEAFNTRKGVGKAKIKLSKFLNNVKGIVLRKQTHEILIKNQVNNGYDEITADDLVINLAKWFGEKNIITTKEVEEAVDRITDRVEPTYNIIQFGNCLYSMKEHKIITPKDNIYCHIRTKYNYNPKAKSRYLKDVLYTNLRRETEKETEKLVQGFLEVIGYLFVSGNPRTVLAVICGAEGSGKSMLGNIITEIFGSEKVADLKLQDMTNKNNTHSTASLEGKYLNMIRDSSKKAITDVGIIKQITGNEDLQINPKNEKARIIKRQEVPSTILNCNNIPKLESEKAVLRRLIIFEFRYTVSGTKNDNPHLEEDILNNPEEMEWLIYQGLEAYKKMELENRDFTLRLNTEDTNKLLDKHSNPINYLLNKLIFGYDFSLTDEDVYIVENNTLNKMCIKLAKDEGLPISLNRNNLIDPKRLTKCLKENLDLEENQITERPYTTVPFKNKRYYPYLKTTELYDKLLDENNF